MDWRLIDKMILFSNNKKSFDLISNIKYRTFPKGQSVKIINPKFLIYQVKYFQKTKKNMLLSIFI